MRLKCYQKRLQKGVDKRKIKSIIIVDVYICRFLSALLMSKIADLTKMIKSDKIDMLNMSNDTTSSVSSVPPFAYYVWKGGLFAA